MKKNLLLMLGGTIILVAAAMLVVMRQPKLEGVPEDFTIAVEIDGKAAAPIDTKQLAGAAIERHYHSWSIWNLRELLDLPARSFVQTERQDGSKLGLWMPADAEDAPHVVLAVDNDGAAAVIMVAAQASDLALPITRAANGRVPAPIVRLRIKTPAAGTPGPSCD